jgi:hypothetical protein
MRFAPRQTALHHDTCLMLRRTSLRSREQCDVSDCHMPRHSAT